VCKLKQRITTEGPIAPDRPSNDRACGAGRRETVRPRRDAQADLKVRLYEVGLYEVRLQPDTTI